MGPELFVMAPLPTCFPTPAPWLSLCLRPRMPVPHLCRPKDYSPSGPDSNIIFFSILCDIHPYLAVTSPSSELPGCFFLFLIMFYLISSLTSISLRAGAMSHFCVLHCPQHSHFCNELIMFPGHTHSQVISSGQEWGSVRKLRLIRVHKATFLFPKTRGRSGVTYGTGNQDQCLQDTTCPSKRSRTQTELSLFPSDVFLLGGQKPETAEFLGALQTAPLPNFHKCFIPKPCPNKKSPKKVKC